MTTLLGVLEGSDYLIITVIVAVFAGGSALTRRPSDNLQRLESQVGDLQRKLDALLKHQGVELPPPPPSGLSPEVERLAGNSSTKIAAIKLYRQQNPGVGLVEAKTKVEAFAAGKT